MLHPLTQSQAVAGGENGIGVNALLFQLCTKHEGIGHDSIDNARRSLAVTSSSPNSSFVDNGMGTASSLDTRIDVLRCFVSGQPTVVVVDNNTLLQSLMYRLF